MARKPMSIRTAAVNAAKPATDKQEAPAVVPEVATKDEKRLTLDMPASLHKKLKMKAMEEDTTMAKMIRGWLEEGVR